MNNYLRIILVIYALIFSTEPTWSPNVSRLGSEVNEMLRLQEVLLQQEQRNLYYAYAPYGVIYKENGKTKVKMGYNKEYLSKFGKVTVR